MSVTMQVFEQTKFGAIFSDVVRDSTFEGAFGYRDLVAMSLDENINGIAISATDHGFGFTAVIFVDGKPDCVMMLDNHGSFLLDRAGILLEGMGTFEFFGVDAERLKSHRNRLDALVKDDKHTAGGCDTDLREEIMQLREENALLARKEALYRTLVEDVHSAIVRIDRNGYCLFINEFGRKMFGIRDAAVGNHLGILCSRDDGPGGDFCSRIAGILARPEEAGRFECRHVGTGGCVHWIAWTISVQHSPSGSVESVLCTGNEVTGARPAQEALKCAEECALIPKDGKHLEAVVSEQVIAYEGDRALLGVITDITGRKLSEVNLRNSPQLYRDIFETTGAATMIVDGDGLVVLANAEFERMFGYTREELEGTRKYKSLFSGDDLAKLARYHNLRRIDPEKAPRSYEANLIDHAGGIRSVWMTASMIPGTAQSVITLMDITDRKQVLEVLREKEERYRIIAENAKDVIWTMDLDLQFTYISPSVTPLLGYTPEDMMAISVDQFLSEDSAAYARQLLLEQYSRLAECESGDDKNFILELECTGKDGAMVWVEARVSFLRDSEGSAHGIMGVAHDIGHRKEEERVRKDALDQIEKNMEQFAILNDHIRNPLQAIVGLVDLEGGPLADKIVSQAAEIDTIIKKLDIGWLESKKISDFLRKHYRMT